MKFFHICLGSLLFLSNCIYSLSLKEKFQSASQGSYICFEHQNMLSCLIFHSVEHDHLYLYELSAPKEAFRPGRSFKDLLLSQSFPSTSTVLYSIDLQKDTIETCFSFTQNSYISIADQSSFLPRLMNLELKELPNSQRKKVSQKAGQVSKEPIFWNPPKTFEGSLIKDRSFDVFKTQWPSDSTELAGKGICLYFDKISPSFPFPYWIEIGDGPLAIKLRAKDSGVFETIPLKFFPKKPIEIVKIDKKDGLRIFLNPSAKDQSFMLVATAYIDGSYESKSFSIQSFQNEGLTVLHIPKAELEAQLKKQFSYQIYFFSPDDPSRTIELKTPIKL